MQKGMAEKRVQRDIKKTGNYIGGRRSAHQDRDAVR
jgi:hypothetical protein